MRARLIPGSLLAAVALALLGVLGWSGPTAAHHEVDAPRNLSARAVDAGVQLDWLPPADDADVDGYEILRRRSNRGEPWFSVLVSDTGNTETSYLDETATDGGTRYIYRVKAIRSGVRSERSHYAMALRTVFPMLLGNLGQTAEAPATLTSQYAQGFRLGGHGQGYEFTGVTIDLGAIPDDLTVTLWISAPPNTVFGSDQPQNRLFVFDNPDSFEVGLNRFTTPAGTFLYPNVNYWIVLTSSGSFSIVETESDVQDLGGENGARIFDSSFVRASGSILRWHTKTSRTGSLRMSVDGSRRDRGMLVSTYAQPVGRAQEILAAGDVCCFHVTTGQADRYLIRSVSVAADNTSPQSSFFGLDFDLLSGSNKLFALPFASARGNAYQSTTTSTGASGAAGVVEWTAPQGATVAGNGTYKLAMSISGVTAAERGGSFSARIKCTNDKNINTDVADTPKAEGVTIGPRSGGDVNCSEPVMAVVGEPLHAMVQNRGQTNDPHKGVHSTSPYVSQRFTTGSEQAGYLFQGIGVNVEGSKDSGVAQIPDGPENVLVSLYTDSSGTPGEKLFDLVSPDEYSAASLTFFEAPPDSWLAPNTSYVMVWTWVSGTGHRLERTKADAEDSGGLSGFSIANDFYSGSDLTNLSKSSGGHSLEIAVYGAAAEDRPLHTIVSSLQQANAGREDDTDTTNVNEFVQNYITAGPTGKKVVVQGFRTGPVTAGYVLQGIGIEVEGSENSGGTAQIPDTSLALNVEISVWTISDARLVAKITNLVAPDSYSPGTESFFSAPAGTTLEPNTDYAMVWEHFRGTHTRLQVTDQDAEDLVGLGDFSIADALHYGATFNSDLTEHPDGHSLEMAVYGYAHGSSLVRGGYQVTPSWLHLPEGARVGDQFRLLFITKEIDANSAEIDDYNDHVQGRAALYLNDRIIRGVAHEFKAVVCTGTVDARTNTGMTDGLGVPIHWLDNGHQRHSTLIAESYDEFYSVNWQQTTRGAASYGNSTPLAGKQFWTGCDASGASHSTAHMGTNSPMGMVALGMPVHDNSAYGPLGSTSSSDLLKAEIGNKHQLYAISPLFTVVAER